MITYEKGDAWQQPATGYDAATNGFTYCPTSMQNAKRPTKVISRLPICWFA